MMACWRGLPFLIAAIGFGCGSRALDPGEMAGTGGVSVTTGSGGATGDGSIGADVPADQHRPTDVLLDVDPQGGPICGNGMIDPGEQCDDGNKAPGDGCSHLCQIECYR